jgi:hypothetical protein
LTVEKKVPTANIVPVQRHAFGIGERVSALDLPKATKPRASPDIVRGIDTVTVEFRRDDRSRPNKAHVAAEYIEQLWEFIETGFAQNLPETANPRVIAQFLRLEPLLSCLRITVEM